MTDLEYGWVGEKRMQPGEIVRRKGSSWGAPIFPGPLFPCPVSLKISTSGRNPDDVIPEGIILKMPAAVKA
ncbi:hypothetical protein TRIP_B330150 [uncultured Desulfatiglans sp.]|uniref:Uncharacterized protein n=1 Tax=Uncultured Desulfatiglans sp. TaxID=1748965 RepID=A0A653A7B4_UNCDX|nr:hypothetical protein TRIP_B330150 [uncultured Desulfatiglans sp.]